MTSIADKKVAFIHYILRDDEGDTIDSSRDADPMPYLHGSGSIVPGLEKALEGKSKGDIVKAVVPPEEAYGELSGAPPQPVPRDAFEGATPEPGMPLVVEDDEGNHLQLWVKEVGETEVLITHDHPLAGVTLHFEVEIMDVRDATAEELAHGHAHHGDGHHHH